MAPKIEEVGQNPFSDERKKGSPFGRRKNKVTVKRDPNEIYPLTNKELNLKKPNSVSNSPLDQLFSNVEPQVDCSIEDATVEKLHENIFGETSKENGYKMRYKVVERLLHYLTEIQRLSNQTTFAEDEYMLKISLHDLRTFSKILNLVIILGMYPALKDFNIGIPLSQRMLNEYNKTKKPIKIENLHCDAQVPVESRYSANEELLQLMYDRFLVIFSTKSDVKDLLLRGTGYSDFLTISLALASVPYFSKTTREKTESDIDRLVLPMSDTYELFQSFSLLMSSKSPVYFKKLVFGKLQSLHYKAPRGDGVLTLIEFVLGLREHEKVGIDKFENVANVILAKPKTIGVVDYFNTIGSQCYDLLVNINKPDVTSCVTYVIERLWQKNELVTRDFFLKKVYDVFNPDIEQEILASEKELNNGINVIISLTKNALPFDLYSELISPIFLQLWAYFVFCQSKGRQTGVIKEIISNYIVTFTSDSVESDMTELQRLAKHIMYQGENTWEFMVGTNNLVQIVKRNPLSNNTNTQEKTNVFLNKLDVACDCFASIMEGLEEEIIVKVLLFVMSQWLNKNKVNIIGDTNPFILLSDMTLLQKIMNKYKDTIARNPKGVLQLIQKYLESLSCPTPVQKQDAVKSVGDNEEIDSDDEETTESHSNTGEILTLLELLGAVLSESTFEADASNSDLLKLILQQLLKLKENSVSQPTICETVDSVSQKIETVLIGVDPASPPSNNDSKVLMRAMNSLNDPLIPIRAHGLYLLRSIIQRKSSIITLDYAIKLHLAQLEDPEPFVYLNVIKGLEELLFSDEESALSSFLVLYSRNSKTFTIDSRLKIGEVLLRYVQKSNELLSRKSALSICETMLGVVRRNHDKELDFDIKLRVSAMSLLGTCLRVNCLNVLEELDSSIECALGVLKLETNDDETLLRRAATVLLYDVLLGLSKANMTLPLSSQRDALSTLEYVCATDGDVLVVEQAKDLIEAIRK